MEVAAEDTTTSRVGTVEAAGRLHLTIPAWPAITHKISNEGNQ
jgi:hypothetical protein